MATKLGMKAKLYFSDTPLDQSMNTPDSVTWTEIGNAKDVTLNLETGEADVTTRANNGWRATRGTLKEGSIEFEMNWGTGDAAFAAIKDAWLNSQEIALAAMDGPIDGSEGAVEGLASNFSVTNFSRSEALEEAIKVSVTVKPSSQSTWYEVPAV